MPVSEDWLGWIPETSSSCWAARPAAPVITVNNVKPSARAWRISDLLQRSLRIPVHFHRRMDGSLARHEGENTDRPVRPDRQGEALGPGLGALEAQDAGGRRRDGSRIEPQIPLARR